MAAALQAFAAEVEERPPTSERSLVHPQQSPAVIVELYRPYLERMLVRIVGWDPELPDLLQEVLLQSFLCVNELKSPAALKVWLTRIAIYSARAWIRKQQRHRRCFEMRPIEELPEMSAIVSDPEVIEELQHARAALDALPPGQRLAFTLRFVDGRELREIATICGVSDSTVKRTLARAEKQFFALARRSPLLYRRMEKQRALDAH
jgi:RNA polymerase sigma-70 factor (ECF subfamily)